MQIETQMRLKMAAAVGKAAESKTPNRPLLEKVAGAYDTGHGVHKVKDWNAHLRMGTFQRLQSQNIMA